MEKLFSGVTELVKASESMMSFSDCPNRCVDGYYIDPYAHKRMICQHCLKRRRELVQEDIKLSGEESICEKLGLIKTVTGVGQFSIDTVLSPSEVRNADERSIRELKEVTEKLIRDASIGVAPSESYMLHFGYKARDMNFIYPFLMKAYISGLTVSRFLTGKNVLETRQKGGYEDLLCTDICLSALDSGAMEQEVLAVKGLMQQRGYRRKSTVIVTSLRGFSLMNEIINSDDYPSYSTARYYQVSFVKKGGQKEPPIGGSMSSEEYMSLIRD